MTRNTLPQSEARQPGLGEPGHMASSAVNAQIRRN